MSDTVTIVGLYPEPLELRGSVWTLNDFYHRFPNLKPDRIYHLHWGFDKDDRPNRFEGDWKAIYRSYDSEIITLDEIDGIDSEILNRAKLVSNFPNNCLTCSIAIMVCQACLEGYQTISIRNVKLLGGEYIYQVRGLLRAMEYVRSKGCTINATHEVGWLANLTKIDWASVSDIQLAYWETQTLMTKYHLKPNTDIVNIK